MLLYQCIVPKQVGQGLRLPTVMPEIIRDLNTALLTDIGSFDILSHDILMGSVLQVR